MTALSDLVSKSGMHRIRKVSDLEFRIEPNSEKGMNVPVTIYANDSLISKMATDRTLDQAANVATLPGVLKHVVVLPDGHEGYGFPVGGVAATDMEKGVISPGGVGYESARAATISPFSGRGSSVIRESIARATSRIALAWRPCSAAF